MSKFLELNIFIGITVLLLMGIGVIWAFRSEKRKWNNGTCPLCKTEWEYFDTDSQGGRGYKCGTNHYMWASYSVERNNPPKEDE